MDVAVRRLKNRIPNRLSWPLRLATWRTRPLPSFIILGAMKAGTTSLFDYLAQHPLLSPSYKKEVHFFDGGTNSQSDTFRKGEAWYRAHFPCGESGDSPMQAFEATPIYMFNPLCPKRISDLIPSVKLIVVLRNPAERAISHYFHVRRRGRETLPMMEAFEAEEERLQPDLDSKTYNTQSFRDFSYKSRGIYYDQLKRFLEYFPREQLLAVCSEVLFSQPKITLERVFDFLGVRPSMEVRDLSARNVASNRTEVPDGVYSYLNNYFLPHNNALYELTQETYDW